MDPWSFGSEGKGLLFSDETDNPFDTFARSRKALMEWEMKPSYSFENDGLVMSGEEAAESVEFMEFGFADMMGKHFHGNPSVVTPNSSFGEVESGWKLSGSVMECSSHDTSLIDLKLGRLGDCENADISKERSLLSSDSVVAKRARTSSTSSYSQPPFCQVQGCNMNLSSSKDYHKRHKVCDAHSKTSRVIVNGIEQRFCQQCSRFHLLAEFDDGKRSCRKRLAGHNERRRKPQLDSFSGKSHKFLQSIQGARFTGAIVDGPFLAKSLPRLHSIGKQQCPGIPLDTPSNNQEISGSSNSSCALSLLSTQSHDLPSGTPNGGALIFPRWGADHSGESFYSSAPNPIHNDHSHHGVHGNKIFQGSGFSNPKQCLCPRQGTTVDLLQLSSHLQRVEQQRSSKQIKQENEDFFGFLTT